MFDHRKKKVRGLKRRIRQLSRWVEANKTPMLTGKSDNCSLKLTFDPWYRILQINPPYGIKKLMTGLLVELYKSWNDYLSSNYKDYYLKLWIYDERFINSQLVAAVGERTGFYDNVFKENKKCGEFPAKKFGLDNITARQF